MKWITFVMSTLLVYQLASTTDQDVKTMDGSADTTGSRDKRNLEYGITHTYGRDARLERRISNLPPIIPSSSSAGFRMYPSFFPSGTKPYTYFRRAKPQLPPYAVQMEPLTLYSQRDPLYDASALSALPQPHNELTKPDDQAADNNHLSESYYGVPKTKYIERPVYIKEPEPIIEIIIKEANSTAPPPVVPALPPKKKKEEVQVFYVKYKKNPHGSGKDSVIYDKPIPAISPIQDDHDEDHHGGYEAPAEYPVPTYAPPPSTTIRAIIKPDSETYQANSGIHVSFGGAHHNPHAEKYSPTHDDDIVESAPQPALSHPDSARRFPSSATFTHSAQEYKPEQRLPQPYRPFNFNNNNNPNINQRPPTSGVPHFQSPPVFSPHHQVSFNSQGPTTSSFNTQQIFNSPVANRFPSLTNSRPTFGHPLKPQPPSLQLNKPYQFERPQQLPFPKTQSHFPIHQQPPISQSSGTFNRKPNFQPFPTSQPLGTYHQQSHQSFGNTHNPPPVQHQQQPTHQPQQVYHPNAFSYQTNFAEQGSFNNQNSGQQFNFPRFQNQNQNQQQHQPQLQQPQFVQQQPQQQRPKEQSSPSFNHQQFGNTFNFGSNNQQPQQVTHQQHHNQNQQHHQHNHQQGQQQGHQQIQQNHHQGQHFIPPGGELIAALPKYEQHISIQSPEATLSPQNFTNQIHQQFRDFSQIPQQQQSSQQQISHVQNNPQNHNFNLQASNQNQQISNQNAHVSNQNQHVSNQNHQFGTNGEYYKPSTERTTPNVYVTSPRPTPSHSTISYTTKLATTTTTTTTTPKPESTTTNLKELNIELPDEVPDDLRQQLLSSGILKNAQISVLDYDKVGDIPISALPPDQLANFYNAGGAQQIASGSEQKLTIVKPDGSSLTGSQLKSKIDVDDLEPTAEASEVVESVAKPTEAKPQAVEMKVVHYDPQTSDGKNVQEAYVKDGATQIEPVVLNDQSYNRYLPLKVSGAKFPIPDVPELKGKNINSVVVLAPVDYNFYKQRVTRNAKLDDDIQLIKNDALKTLVKEPTLENYEKFLENENKTKSAQQAVILLVTGSDATNREIFMYDVATKSVSKLDGELSAAFVDAAESNTSPESADASNVVETKVPVPDGIDIARLQSSSSNQDEFYELQPEASDIFETKVPIIDPMQTDLDSEASEQLEQFVDITSLQSDLTPAASNTNEQIVINSGYSKTELQMPSH